MSWQSRSRLSRLDGKPVTIALSVEQFESLLETLEILSDREFMTELREGIRQANAVETVSIEQLKAAVSTLYLT